jgi:hypothetical protein
LLALQGAGEGGDRSEPLRLTVSPKETDNLEAETDATDQLEVPNQNLETAPYTGTCKGIRQLPSDKPKCEVLIYD